MGHVPHSSAAVAKDTGKYQQEIPLCHHEPLTIIKYKAIYSAATVTVAAAGSLRWMCSGSVMLDYLDQTLKIASKYFLPHNASNSGKEL